MSTNFYVGTRGHLEDLGWLLVDQPVSRWAGQGLTFLTRDGRRRTSWVGQLQVTEQLVVELGTAHAERIRYARGQRIVGGG